MKYKKCAEDWLDNAPRAYVHIGRFMLKYRYEYEREWGMGWLSQENSKDDLDWEDTPESNYYNELCHALESSWHNTCFIDDVLAAMQEKPFNQGETK